MAITEQRKPIERSKLTEIHTGMSKDAPVIFHSDVPLTRRKKFHMVEAVDGEIIFRSRWVEDILDYFTRHGVHAFTITTPRGSYTAHVERQIVK